MKKTQVRVPALVALLCAFTIPPKAQAQDRDDVEQTVIRVAYVSGEVSYSRGDNPDEWQAASLNFPMTLGDRLYTAKGSRLELQTEGGAVYLAPETEFGALNLTYDVAQFSLGMGSASFRIRRIDSGESFEVDTPNAAVTFDRPGDYRIDVDRNGSTRVIVNRGSAHVAAAGGEVPLGQGRMMSIDGVDSPVYDVVSLPRPDPWDRWVGTRAARFRDTGSRRYVNADISGVDDLDQYGRWSQIPEYGSVWSPGNVSSDWQPYRSGRWAWQDPWGWSWVSNEAWGWAPYHYGRWVNSRARWYWVPVGPDVRSVRYAPALVGFVGGGGLSVSISAGGGGYVGWFPLAPRDPFVPWWGSRGRDTNVTNVTYVNRTHVTIVNQNTFISGAMVAKNTIRDRRVVRDFSSAAVVHGPLAVVPVAASIRVSGERARSAPRPPAAALTRPVVTRLAPAAAPVRFREKENLIRENHGAPVGAAQAARLSQNSQPIRPSRSVVAEPGRVTFAPKRAQSDTPAPVPVTRGVAPGKARREAPPAAPREVPPGQAKSAPEPERRSGENARPAESQSRQQLEAERQKEVETRRQQQAEGARKQQQQEADSRRQQQAEGARRQQQQEADTRKQQQAEGARRQQQQEADSRKQQQAAEGARKRQQELEARKPREAAARPEQAPRAAEPRVTREQKPAQPKAAEPKKEKTAEPKKEKSDKDKDRDVKRDGNQN